MIHVSIDPSVPAAPPTSISSAAFPTTTSTSTSSTETPTSSDNNTIADTANEEEEGEGQAGDAWKALTNVRSPRESDGLLSIPEILRLFPVSTPLRSVYDSAYRDIVEAHPDQSITEKELGKTFGARLAAAAAGITPQSENQFSGQTPVDNREPDLSRKGLNEPMYTSFTHYWRLTLVRLITCSLTFCASLTCS